MYFNGSIGRITDYVKTVQFEQKWQQKKIEISVAKPKDVKRIDDWLKAKRLEDIKNKMKSGRRLSYNEKEFLRIHAPNLYEKAMKIEKERDEFRRALANCKTKEEVRRLQTSKFLELKIEAQAMSGNSKDEKKQGDLEFIAMRMMAIFDEFADFVKSKEYADIPNEHEEDGEESDEKNENMANIRKNEKSKKSKKIKSTLSEEMALNSYKLNEAKVNSYLTKQPRAAFKAMFFPQ
jgi:hypothetical protein